MGTTVQFGPGQKKRPVRDRFQGLLGYRGNETLRQITVSLFDEWTNFHYTVHVIHILPNCMTELAQRMVELDGDIATLTNRLQQRWGNRPRVLQHYRHTILSNMENIRDLMQGFLIPGRCTLCTVLRVQDTG